MRFKSNKSYNFKNIIIIDLDVHQGDGTASILSGIKKYFTFSMHCEKNFPFQKIKAILDIVYEGGYRMTEYIEYFQKIV